MNFFYDWVNLGKQIFNSNSKQYGYRSRQGCGVNIRIESR